MTIHLSKDLQKIVHDAMSAGLYDREDDVVRDALLRLRRDLPESLTSPAQGPGRVEATPDDESPLTPDELNRRLLAAGLVARLPDPAEDLDDDDEPPIVIRGEPLSETILRGRR